MKKNFFYGFVVLAIVAVAAFNVNLNLSQKNNMSLLTLANIEALAKEGVHQCDITVYNRNAQEGWKTEVFRGTVGVDGYVTVKGKLRVGPFTAGSEVTFTYRVGDCPYSEGNCCIKTHVDRVKLL